jgi:hypothetical protein
MRNQARVEWQRSFFMPTLREQLDPRQSLYQLAGKLPWEDFEAAFAGYYSAEGRPAKAVRLMVGLLLLKQLHDLGDETVVAQRVQNHLDNCRFDCRKNLRRPFFLIHVHLQVVIRVSPQFDAKPRCGLPDPRNKFSHELWRKNGFSCYPDAIVWSGTG